MHAFHRSESVTQNQQFRQTHSLVMSPLGPVGVASFGSIPWVSRMCLAAGLRRNLGNQAGVREMNA